MARYRVITRSNIDEMAEFRKLPKKYRKEFLAVSRVIPFKANPHLFEIIDWSNPFEDPIFRMTFPHTDMLPQPHIERLISLIDQGDDASIRILVDKIRTDLNPHPGGQLELNRPKNERGEILTGIQHKYPQTVLYFPPLGQTCHAYCAYCFRWPQFVQGTEKFAMQMGQDLIQYIERNPSISDVIITGGDPLIMSTSALRAVLEPLSALEQLKTIRIGTKAHIYWPYRFTRDEDAKSLLELFKKTRKSSVEVFLMCHNSHARELSHPETRRAIYEIRNSGVRLKSQAPIIRYVNNTHQSWANLWKIETALGIEPYYMFIARNTGAEEYFSIPLREALEIYKKARANVTGIVGTATGPVMSCSAGKIQILSSDFIANNNNNYTLRFVRSRNEDLRGYLFRATGPSNATWISELRSLDPNIPSMSSW